MPTDPLVACVCLVKGRPEMVRRAVRSYFRQTYTRRMLLLWATETPDLSLQRILEITEEEDYFQCVSFAMNRDRGLSIGALRNEAAERLFEGPAPHPDIIAHWDSDDWSHPDRLTEQVKLLQESQAQAVGYNDLLFWQEPKPDSLPHGLAEYECRCTVCIGAAWLYARPRPRVAVGTSLMYWAGVWKQNRFPDLPKPGQPWSLAEDSVWMQQPQINLRGFSSIRCCQTTCEHAHDKGDGYASVIVAPRMIASLHGQNTYAEHYQRMMAQGADLQRVPQWDDYCRTQMTL